MHKHTHTYRHAGEYTNTHREARYQSEMALKRLNERLKAEMTMFSGRL